MAQTHTHKTDAYRSYRTLIANKFHADRVASRRIQDRGVQDRIADGCQSSACGAARCTMEIKHLCEELRLQRFWAADFVVRFPEHRLEFEAMEMVPTVPDCGRAAKSNPHTPYGSSACAESSASQIQPVLTTSQAPSSRGPQVHPVDIEGSPASSDVAELAAAPPSHTELIPDLLTFDSIHTNVVLAPVTRLITDERSNCSESSSLSIISSSSNPAFQRKEDRLFGVDSETKRDVHIDLPFRAAPNVPLLFTDQHAAGAFGDPSLSQTVIISNLPKAIELGQVLKQVRCGRVVKAILVSTVGIANMEEKAVMIRFDTPKAAQRFLTLTADRTFGFMTADGHQAQALILPSRVASHPWSPYVRQCLDNGHTRCLLIGNARGVHLQKALQGLCSGRPFNTIITDCMIVDSQNIYVAFASIEMANTFFRHLINIESREGSVHAHVRHAADPCTSLGFDTSETPFFDCIPIKDKMDELLTTINLSSPPVAADGGISGSTQVGGTNTPDTREADLREIFRSAGLIWPEAPPQEAHANRENSNQWPSWDGINREGKHCRYERDPLSGAVQFRLWVGDKLSAPSMYTDEYYKEWLYYNLESEDIFTQESLDLYFAAYGLPNLRKLDQYVKQRDSGDEKDAAL